MLATLFLGPLVFSRGSLDAFGLPKAAVLWVGGLVALGGVALSVAAGDIVVPRLRLAVPAVALLVASSLATTASIAPWVSLRGGYDRYNGLVTLALCEAIAFVVAALFFRRPRRLREVAFVLAVSSVLATAYVLLQFLRLDPIKWGPGASASFLAKANARHPPGTLGNSNYVGGTLGVLLPFVAWAAAAATTRGQRAFWLTATMMQVVAVWLSRSRGGLMGVTAALLVLAISNRDRVLRLAGGARLPLRPVVIGAVALVVVAAPLFSRPRLSEMFDRLTVVRRYQYWRGALGVFGARPILGTGPDTFYAAYGRHRPAVDGAGHGLVSLPDKPHNLYLEYAASTGMLGLGAFVGVMALAITYAIRASRRLDGPARALLSAFLAALAAYLVQATVSFDALPLPVLAWTSIGAIAALADPGAASGKVLVRRRGTRPLAGALGVAVLVAAPLVAAPLRADRAAKLGQDRENAGRFDEAARWFRRATALDRTEPTYPFRLAVVNEKLAGSGESPAATRRHLLAAMSLYGRARRYAPGYPYIERGFARASTTFAEKVDAATFPAADRAWRSFVADDPTDWEPRVLHADMLITWAEAGGGDVQRRRARAELDRVRRMPKLEARASIKVARAYARLGDPYWIEVVRQMELRGEGGI